MVTSGKKAFKIEVFDTRNLRSLDTKSFPRHAVGSCEKKAGLLKKGDGGRETDRIVHSFSLPASRCGV